MVTQPGVRRRGPPASVLDTTVAEVPATPRPACSPTRGVRPGARLGRYRVGPLLGQGGMGAVYAGVDPVLGRRVALKVCRPRGRDREAVARMTREARMLARVCHPHVVEIFDVGRFDDGYFVAMELVEGRALDAWLKAEPRPRREVLQVFAQAGAGLVALHRQGLVHRDFKPGNAILGDDGRVRVLDLGLAVDTGHRGAAFAPARSVERSTRLVTTATEASGPITLMKGPHPGDMTRLTTTGTAVGTPAYMAPEQHLGRPIDSRADQYSFCLALFEALAGERPYHGACIRDLLEDKLQERTCAHVRRIPRRLRKLVLRGLRADRQCRWPSMGELLRALAGAA